MSDMVAHFEEPVSAPKKFQLPEVAFERAWNLTKWLADAPDEEFGDRFWENAQDAKQDIFDEHNEYDTDKLYFIDFEIDGDKLLVRFGDAWAIDAEYVHEVAKVAGE